VEVPYRTARADTVCKSRNACPKWAGVMVIVPKSIFYVSSKVPQEIRAYTLEDNDRGAAE